MHIHKNENWFIWRSSLVTMCPVGRTRLMEILKTAKDANSREGKLYSFVYLIKSRI